jgi:hypothetical protein
MRLGRVNMYCPVCNRGEDIVHQLAEQEHALVQLS